MGRSRVVKDIGHHSGHFGKCALPPDCKGASTLTWLKQVPNSLNHTDPNGLEPAMILAEMTDDGMAFWLQFWRLGAWSGARSLLSQGLAAKIRRSSPKPHPEIPALLTFAAAELTGSGDSTNLAILNWYYNDILYNSTEALRAALRDPSFERLRPNLGGDWVDTEDYSEGSPERQMPPPVMVQPSGPRYHIDRKESYVSWSKLSRY